MDPKVACVFKTLFGSHHHRDLLIHFLNALLAEDLAAPITAVDILSPKNEPETLEAGGYDSAHIAISLRPERARALCKTDRPVSPMGWKTCTAGRPDALDTTDRLLWFPTP
nr:PD-(D/E)XK nuclease family transposase [Thiocapsa sp.]